MNLLAQLLQAQPSVKDGEVEPYDLGYQKDVGNYLQDQSDLLSDPIFLAMSEGGFDPAAFQDVPDGEEVVEREMPTRPKLDAYLRGNPESLSTQIANAIAAGGTPEGVIEVLKSQRVIDPADVEAERSALDLAGTLFDEQTSFDDALAKIPKDEDGQPILREVKQNYKPSAAAQTFRDAALPLPTDPFLDTDFAPNVEDRRADYRGAVSEQRAASDALRALQAQQQRAADAPAPSALPDWLTNRAAAQPPPAARTAPAVPARPDVLDGVPQMEPTPLATFGDFTNGAFQDTVEAQNTPMVGGPISLSSAPRQSGIGGASGDALADRIGRIANANQRGQDDLPRQLAAAQAAYERAQANSSKVLGQGARDMTRARVMQRLMAQRGETPFKQAMLARAGGLRSLGL